MNETKSKSVRFPAVAGFAPRMGIAQKIGVVFVALLMVAAVNIMLVHRMMTQSDQVADTVNVTGKLRMLGQRIALQAVSYSHDRGAGELEVRQLMRDFDTVLHALSAGGYVFGMYIDALSPVHRSRVEAVSEQWAVYRQSVSHLLDEAARHRQRAAGDEASMAPAGVGHFDLMLEEMATHSTRLLERTEALMSGILTDIEVVQSQALTQMYALLAFDAALIMLAFMAIRRQIVVPLRDLSTHCGELAAGNYNTRFLVSTNDEIGVLARAFNDSAWRIGSLIDRIEKDRHDLEQAESMFRGIAENSMVGVYIAHKGRFRYVNAKMAEIFGYTRAEMIEHGSAMMVFPDVVGGELPDLSTRERLTGEVPGLWMERKGQRKDGTQIEVEVFASLMTLDDDRVTMGIALDITRRKEVEAQARLAMLVHRHSSEAMVVTDAEGRLMSVNPAFTQITGYQPEEVIGKRLNILSSGRHSADFYREMWEALESTGHWEGDIWNQRKNGEIFAERLIINTNYDDDGTPLHRIGLFSDITHKKRADEAIWRQANFDTLTGLPNRQQFLDRIEKEMKRSDTMGRPLALMFLDLDDFKYLNDTLGHATGDKVLTQVAQRLQTCVRSTDMVARLGGDEFVLILGALSDLEVVDRVSNLVMERLSEPFVVETEQTSVSASMGITFYPLDATSVKELLQNADPAMYTAKARGKHQTARFLPSMQAHMTMRRELARDLALARHDGQFHLMYQPIVELDSGRIDKVECLLRWKHPEKGLVAPNIFVPFAEDTGMIKEIGEWVFCEAVRQISKWRDIAPSLQVSVNVSPVQFEGNTLCPMGWLKQLERLGMAGANVVVEITERLLMDADANVSSKLIAFRDAGVQVALDDFGTGYSSMTYLKRFDIDYIKIDQSFIRNLDAGSDDLVLCEAMIVMAHRLGLKVVAEGVETEVQYELLKAAGCDFAQGYLFSPPVSASELEDLLRAGSIARPTINTHNTSTGRFDQRT